MDVRFVGKGLRILDFDCECRPLAWYGGDFVTKQPTAIAWKVIGSSGKPKVALLGTSGDPTQVHDEEVEMLETFIEAFNEADLVTGHFIRGFDLPLLNGALIRLGMTHLTQKLTQDTKLDFAKRTGVSMSQENLGAMFELKHPKVSMNTTLWAEGNMLTPSGINITKTRVVGDVEQHIELRQQMLNRELLRAPNVWTPQSSGVGRYHA